MGVRPMAGHTVCGKGKVGAQRELGTSVWEQVQPNWLRQSPWAGMGRHWPTYSRADVPKETYGSWFGLRR